jgi:AcrR family transcriptional regulator
MFCQAAPAEEPFVVKKKKSARSTAPAPAPTPSRRMPLQDRSRKRVEQILDAAAQVFAERGYDAATTEEIARLAETSIGSVYQFFPNKLALFNAITIRYVERAQALFGTLMTPAALHEPWDELLGRGIDAFAALNRNEPGFRAILVNWRISADMLLANDDVNREFARRAETVLAAQAPGLTAEKRALVATVVIEVVSSMLLLSIRRAPDDGDAILAEAKTLLFRYLGPIVGREESPRQARLTREPSPPQPPLPQGERGRSRPKRGRTSSPLPSRERGRG